MKREEIADPRAFLSGPAIIFAKLKRMAVAAGKQVKSAKDSALGEMKMLG